MSVSGNKLSDFFSPDRRTVFFPEKHFFSDRRTAYFSNFSQYVPVPAKKNTVTEPFETHGEQRLTTADAG